MRQLKSSKENGEGRSQGLAKDLVRTTKWSNISKVCDSNVNVNATDPLFKRECNPRSVGQVQGCRKMTQGFSAIARSEARP